MISWRDEVGMATLELNGALDNAVEELEGRIR
jgi:hypothetical protein